MKDRDSRPKVWYVYLQWLLWQQRPLRFQAYLAGSGLHSDPRVEGRAHAGVGQDMKMSPGGGLSVLISHVEPGTPGLGVEKHVFAQWLIRQQ